MSRPTTFSRVESGRLVQGGASTRHPFCTIHDGRRLTGVIWGGDSGNDEVSYEADRPVSSMPAASLIACNYIDRGGR